MNRHRLAIGVVLGVYTILGFSYAWRTPGWQVPDEPAHFNYVAQVGDDPFDPPEIEQGDYPFERLETLKASHFGDKTDYQGIEYEDHQPPAYYYLASLYFRGVGGEPDIEGGITSSRPKQASSRESEGRGREPDPLSDAWPDPLERAYIVWAVRMAILMFGLRLLGVLLGAITVLIAWRIAALLYPRDGILPVATAAFVAFLPMNLTMTAAVNNDPLAYAVIAATLLVALKRLLGRMSQRRFVVLGGLLFGLAILTKVSVMGPAAVVLAAAEVIGWWRRGRVGTATTAATVAGTLGLGLLIGLPWMLRNARVYGAGDWFGLRAHDRVVDCVVSGVQCQPRTADWIAEKGLADLVLRFAEFTFKSFWGVFGWMAVFLTDIRGIPIYGVLALVSLAALVGFALYLLRLRHAEDVGAADQRWGLMLLGLSLAVTVGGYLWYNLTFVQHQGRYLFPALIPIALGFMLGLRELARRGAGFAGLGAERARWVEAAVLCGFAAALAGLAWISLTRYVVPGLG